MKAVPPFVAGYVVSSFLIGAGVGITMDLQAAAFGAGLLVGGALVSCLLCWWLLGFDAPWRRLLPAALFTNPTFVVALFFVVHDIGCLTGGRRGWECLAAAIAIVIGGGALPTPLGGLVWRWWKRRGTASTTPQ